MGFLDNFLNAVESGALEKRLEQFADAVDKTGKQAHGTLKVVSERPGELLKAAEKKKDDVEEKVQSVRQHVGTNLDIVRKKG